MSVDYGIKVPIETYGLNDLKQVYEAIRGTSGAMQGLTGDLRKFAKDARDEFIAANGNMNRALNEIRRGATGASEGFQTLAGKIQEYNLRTREAEAQTAR